MMDYFDVVNSFWGNAFQKKVKKSDTVQNPVTYEKWKDGNKIGFKAKSTYDSAVACATRLTTYFHVVGAEENQIVRDFDSNGIPTIWIPKGSTIVTSPSPQDTKGATNTSFKDANEPSNERAGVNVEYRQFSNDQLNSTAINVLRQENPELFDFDNLELEDLESWWTTLNKKHSDVVNRLMSADPELYYPTVETQRIRSGATSKQFNQEGLYRVDSIYGYDWDAEIDSQRAGYELGKGDDFMGLSWSGLGYYSLQSVYYLLYVYSFFRASLTYKLMPSASHFSKVGASKMALWAVETLIIDIFLLELPYYVRQVDATKNHHLCGFPNGGHYQSMNIHVYDPAVRDWKGTPHCKSGEKRRIVSESPLEYDPNVPCCPDNSTYNSTTGLCESGEVAILPNDGSRSSINGGTPFSNEKDNNTLIVGGVVLGLIGLTMLTGFGGSK